MSPKAVFRSIVPTPRRPFRMKDALPLVLFLAVYAAAILTLEWTDRVAFTHPWAFALMIFSVWVWWMHVGGFSGLPAGRAVTALVTRLLILGLFVMALAEPRSVRTSDTLSVVYALDLSDSIGDGSASEGLQFILQTVVDKPSGDEAGLITFGRNAAVELPPRQAFPFEALNSRIERDATNLEQSLTMAAALLPEQTRGRIVLISDGSETAGDLTRVIDELNSREIAVDVLPISYEYDREMWVERLDLPSFVKLSEPYEAAVLVNSLQDEKGTLRLKENGNVIFEQEVDIRAGKNRYAIPIRIDVPGHFEYEATISPADGSDHLTQNNAASGSIFVEGQGKVLIVTDPFGKDQDFLPLSEALMQSERLVEAMSAYELPRDPLALMPYDCVIFVNVPREAFDAAQLDALHTAIFDQGLGFLMVGGENSFGPGGYHRTVVEQALPVSMDISQKKILPKGALVIILHTCEFPEGNTWGKRITKQAIKVLGSEDEVGVIAYTAGGADWLFELTPASEYESMVPKINGAVIGDMPSFAPTMQMGLEGLMASDAATRHMIIISDGDPTPPSDQLVADFVDNGVSMSMVAIFPHGGEDIAKLRAIASVTGGRYYMPTDPNRLPGIFIKEAKTLKRNMIQEKTVTPQIGFPSEVLKGIDEISPLDGYVLTSPKPRSETVLVIPSEDVGGEELDPLLSIWRYGLGTTAAFTSDLTTGWAERWVNGSFYRAFVEQLITKISRAGGESHLNVWTYRSGGEEIITVEDFHPEEMFLDLQAKVLGPQERTEVVQFKQIAPRRYQASVPLWGKGRYTVNVVGASGERTDRAFGGYTVSYSPEYLRFRSDPIALNEIREKTGGVQLTPDATAGDIFNRREPKRSSQPIFDWFLIFLACLIPADVAIRRVQIDWGVIRGWFTRRSTEATTATMGTLLARKQQVSSNMQAPRSPARPSVSHVPPPPSSPRPAAPRPSGQAKQKQDEPSAPAATGTATSTTGRLLDLKRRREQGGNGQPDD